MHDVLIFIARLIVIAVFYVGGTAVIVHYLGCSLGIHRWEYPGGPCELCGKEDDLWNN